MPSSLATSRIPEQSSRAAPDVTLTGVQFVPGGEFTVGAEDELLLGDATNRLSHTASTGLVERLGGECREVATVSSELYASEIEFATGVRDDGAGVAACLAAARARLQRAGGRGLAVGVHPSGEFGEAPLTDAARYREIGDSLAGLLRTPTASFQVHVGLPDAETAVTAHRGLRPHLAVFNALAAGSPFWHGRDSGLASARWGVINSYPRGGLPPALQSWEEYVALAEAVLAAAEAPDYTHLWWDARIQPRFGTVEVRVMDAQPSLDAIAGLTALIQGVVRHAVEQPGAPDVPSPVLTENDFRVARHGLEARIVDVDGSMRPVRDLAAELLARARAVLDDGQTAALDGVAQLLTDEPGYTRQRRIHAESGMAAVLGDLAVRTMRGW
jgi:carboxylate-amine ligase